MGEIAVFLLENATAAVAHMIVGVVVIGALGSGLIAATVFAARKWGSLKVGAPFDPWPMRLTFALWVLVALPAFAIAGGVVGLGFAVENAVKQNHVTERIAHASLQVLLNHVLADGETKKYVAGNVIKIVDVTAFVERAPEALDNFTHEGAEAAVRAAGTDNTIVKVSARVAASIAGWIAKSQAKDRLEILSPVLADLQTRDADGDGRVAVSDVLDSLLRIQLEPRAAHFARGLVVGQALLPAGVGIAGLVVPLVICFAVRRRRSAKPPAPSLTTP